METRCPKCNQQIEVDDQLVGQTVVCPSCSENLILPIPCPKCASTKTHKIFLINPKISGGFCLVLGGVWIIAPSSSVFVRGLGVIFALAGIVALTGKKYRCSQCKTRFNLTEKQDQHSAISENDVQINEANPTEKQDQNSSIGQNDIQMSEVNLTEKQGWRHLTFAQLTCKGQMGEGPRRLLLILSIPFFLFYILPGVIFWLLVRVVLWVIAGFREDSKAHK
jgi:hypothetical protein